MGNAAISRRNEDDPWGGEPEQILSAGSLGFQLTNDAVAVPELATLVLFAAGLAGLGVMNCRKKSEMPSHLQVYYAATFSGMLRDD